MIGFGSKFFVISMLFDKVLLIFIRYGKFLIITFLSLIISSYLYISITYGINTIKIHNLMNRPEIVLKNFWEYLKYYYRNRSNLPLSETFKLISYLFGPYIFLKTFLIFLNFSKFWIAIKIRNTFPTIANFLLRKTTLSTQMKDQIINLAKKPNSDEKNNNPIKNTAEKEENTNKKRNLRY
jgi:hypothetical protein